MVLMAAAPAGAQDVWLDATLDLWTSVPKAGQPMFRYGRESRVGFIALLPQDKAVVWSYSLYDFPGPSGSRTDRFFYRIKGRKEGSSGYVGRFYSPFGSPDIEAYDKYVETSDESLTRNALLDAFGDGVGATYPIGRALAQVAIQDLAVQSDDRTDFFARVDWVRTDGLWGLSVYRDTGGSATRREAEAVYLSYSPQANLLISAEYVAGKPLGERATCTYYGARYEAGKWLAFGSSTNYAPDGGTRARTRRIGAGYQADPLTSVSVWHENHLQGRDRTVLSFSTSIR